MFNFGFGQIYNTSSTISLDLNDLNKSIQKINIKNIEDKKLI